MSFCCVYHMKMEYVYNIHQWNGFFSVSSSSRTLKSMCVCALENPIVYDKKKCYQITVLRLFSLQLISLKSYTLHLDNIHVLTENQENITIRWDTSLYLLDRVRIPTCENRCWSFRSQSTKGKQIFVPLIIDFMLNCAVWKTFLLQDTTF